jgi:hypothetical protein
LLQMQHTCSSSRPGWTTTQAGRADRQRVSQA